MVAPPRRSVWKLGVIGGVAGLILTVAAVLVVGQLMRDSGSVTRLGWWGPQHRAVSACNAFGRWDQTAAFKTNLTLLSYAAGQADSARLISKARVHLRTDLDGLRAWIREPDYAPASSTTYSHEVLINNDCAQVMAAANEEWPLQPGGHQGLWPHCRPHCYREDPR